MVASSAFIRLPTLISFERSFESSLILSTATLSFPLRFINSSSLAIPLKVKFEFNLKDTQALTRIPATVTTEVTKTKA